jgi:hypothetical protein
MIGPATVRAVPAAGLGAARSRHGPATGSAPMPGPDSRRRAALHRPGCLSGPVATHVTVTLSPSGPATAASADHTAEQCHSLSISPAGRGFAAGPRAESLDSAFIICKLASEPVRRRAFPSDVIAWREFRDRVQLVQLSWSPRREERGDCSRAVAGLLEGWVMLYNTHPCCITGCYIAFYVI